MENQIKELDKLIEEKKAEVQELDNKLTKRWGSNYSNPNSWVYWKRLNFLEGFGGVIALVIIVILLIISFIVGKLI
jgi:hypothetical protein